MKTRKFAGILCLLLACVPALDAQDQAEGQRAERAQQRLQQVKERLNLTPEQIEQVRPVFIEEVQQMKAVREKYGAGDMNRRTKLKMGRELRGIRDNADEKLRTILSKQQMEELKKMRKEWREEFRERASQR